MPVPGGLRSELERREEVVTFEVGVIVEDLFDRHAAGEQLEKALHRIAQSADRRLPVADGGVDVIRSRRDTTFS